MRLIVCALRGHDQGLGVVDRDLVGFARHVYQVRRVVEAAEQGADTVLLGLERDVGVLSRRADEDVSRGEPV